ncbi:hypothetical protein, partial [Ligilactobacillus murinus]|uniref:hypothetical protein n=2 Tax=Lactobacillaceae TaxID=33958 RepID=UPI0016526AA5
RNLSSKENLVIVKPPKLDSFVQLRGFTSAEAFEAYIKVVGMPKKGKEKIDWSVHGGKSHAPRGKRKDRYFRKWYLFDTQTGEKHEFEIAQEVADFVGCGVTTVIIARKKKTMLKKRYKVIAVK